MIIITIIKLIGCLVGLVAFAIYGVFVIKLCIELFNLEFRKKSK